MRIAGDDPAAAQLATTAEQERILPTTTNPQVWLSKNPALSNQLMAPPTFHSSCLYIKTAVVAQSKKLLSKRSHFTSFQLVTESPFHQQGPIPQIKKTCSSSSLKAPPHSTQRVNDHLGHATTTCTHNKHELHATLTPSPEGVIHTPPDMLMPFKDTLVVKPETTLSVPTEGLLPSPLSIQPPSPPEGALPSPPQCVPLLVQQPLLLEFLPSPPATSAVPPPSSSASEPPYSNDDTSPTPVNSSPHRRTTTRSTDNKLHIPGERLVLQQAVDVASINWNTILTTTLLS
eukprot:jgi/Psemu1/28001/gm1.28001_g